MFSFKSVEELITAAELKNTTISQVALAETALDMEITEQEVYAKMAETYMVMESSIEQGAEPDLKSASGLAGGMAHKMKTAAAEGRTVAGDFMADLIANALAVAELNACMGKIVAAPTAGSCGIIPACLCTVKKYFDIPQEKVVMGLINASAIGMIIAARASISGAEGGCQAECGAAAAMAASAVVEIIGGSPSACGTASAQALKSVMGLVCAPVAGLVEEPCIVRNASCASIAITAAELSLAGIASIIPVDEVIDTMQTVGSQMPACLRETAEGGIAITPTALKIAEMLMNKSS